jgi:hypothetical protein
MEDDRGLPVKRFRIGNVTAAVWKSNGGYSVTLQKSYKRDDEWKNTDSMFHADILNAMKVLERAEEYIATE